MFPAEARGIAGVPGPFGYFASASCLCLALCILATCRSPTQSSFKAPIDGNGDFPVCNFVRQASST